MNRLVRLKKEKEGWAETAVLLEEIPGSHIHNGGRVKIGPDGKIYVTTGDAAVPEWAQDVESLAGKILRLEMDGSIPKDNPYPNSPVFSYGHRNPQGLAWDEKGHLYASEHGSDAHDELNKIEAGKNYGWPMIRGDEKKAGMESPVFHTDGETWAPSGIAYHHGRLYVAGLRGEAVYAYELAAGKAGIFQEGHGRIRDVWMEGNELFFVTCNTDGRGTPAENDDRLLKVTLK
jgi:glucose/arabinose dehydrogenase